MSHIRCVPYCNKPVVRTTAYKIFFEIVLFSIEIVLASIGWSTLPSEKLKLTWKPEKMLSRTFGFFMTAQDHKTHLAEFRSCIVTLSLFTHQAVYSM